MPVSMQRLTRGPNWDPQEDKQLAKAWVISSTDGEVGTDQKADTFWEKVASTYNNIRPRTHKNFERGGATLVMKRWKTLRVAVASFCGCYASVLQLNESSKSAEDHIDDSEVRYEKIYDQSASSDGGDGHASDVIAECAEDDIAAVAAAERSRTAGKKKTKTERSVEASSQRITDAAGHM
ncbi:hypothetical protein PF003_g6612 [Phytophthora fragariae]|nr:hypothetical protein PF003_g6612 [Phytophthora fragariae]